VRWYSFANITFTYSKTSAHGAQRTSILIEYSWYSAMNSSFYSLCADIHLLILPLPIAKHQRTARSAHIVAHIFKTMLENENIDQRAPSINPINRAFDCWACLDEWMNDGILWKVLFQNIEQFVCIFQISDHLVREFSFFYLFFGNPSSYHGNLWYLINTQHFIIIDRRSNRLLLTRNSKKCRKCTERT